MKLADMFHDARGRPWLAELDPRLKIALVGWFSLLAILLESTTALMTMFLVSLVLAAGLRMGWQAWLTVSFVLGLIAWSTALSQALFIEPEPGSGAIQLIGPGRIGSWEFAGLRLSKQGALYGLAQSLRMLTVTLVGLTVCLSTSSERLLSAMARLGVPVSISFLTVTTMRFLPLLVSQWLTIRQARRLRGYRLRLWHLATPYAGRVVASEISLLTPLLASAVRRAAALATSVASRGFDPTAQRTYYPELRFRRTEVVWLVLLAATVGLLLVIKSLHWLHTGGWHSSESLQCLYDFTAQWL